MAVNPGEVVKVVCKMQDANGSLIENVYFWEHQGSNPVSNNIFLADIELKMSATYGLLSTSFPVSLVPTSIACDIVSWVGGKLTVVRPVGEVPWTTWAGGTSGGEVLPHGCAAVVNFTSDAAGIMGRKYLGPLVENVQSGGLLSSGTQADLASFAAALLSGVLVNTTEQFNNIIMSSKYAAARDILAAVVNAIVGYQRRRKAGVGM